MRFAVSLLAFRPGRIGGAETYLRQLLAHMPAVAGRDELSVLMDRDLAGELETPGFERVVVNRSSGRIVVDRILEAYTAWRARGIERTIDTIGADAMLFPQQSIFPKRASVRAVLTAVDVQHLFFPENFNLFDRTFRPAIYPYSMKRAAKIIAISEFTRKTLIERCGVPPEKVVSVPLGFSAAEAQADQPTDRVKQPYFYYPAATHPHKNHALLLRTFATLRKRGAISERLVFTGIQTARWKQLHRLVRDLGIEKDVIHLGYLPFSEVRRVYAGASAVLFPTTFEGFGLPVTEAAGFGKKIITSRLEVFDEIGVPRRFQIDFADPDQLLAAIGIEGATSLEKRPSTWTEMAQQTIDVMRQVAGPERARDAAMP